MPKEIICGLDYTHHSDGFRDHQEPVEDLPPGTGYDGVCADDTDPLTDDIEDALPPLEVAPVVRNAVETLVEMLEGDTPVYVGDRDGTHALLATVAQDPALTDKITDPGRRALALAEIARDTNDPELASSAAQIAVTIDDMDQRVSCLTGVAIRLGSTEPLAFIPDEEEYRQGCLGKFAGATGNLDVLDEITDPFFRNSALTAIAERTGNPLAAEMIPDQSARNRAYLRIATKTGDTEMLEKISDQGLRDIGRREIAAGRAEQPSPWEEIEQRQLADLVPVEHVTEIGDPLTMLEQSLVHLKYEGCTGDVRATLTNAALGVIRRISPHQYDWQDSYYRRLSLALGDPEPSHEALQNALDQTDNPDRHWRILTALRTIREIERAHHIDH